MFEAENLISHIVSLFFLFGVFVTFYKFEVIQKKQYMICIRYILTPMIFAHLCFTGTDFCAGCAVYQYAVFRYFAGVTLLWVGIFFFFTLIFSYVSIFL